MRLQVTITESDMGVRAAEHGAELIREAIATKGQANIIVATGASQFKVLENLVKYDIDWPHVVGFHLDEYIGLGGEHPASFRRYLRERLVDKVPMLSFHYVDGDAIDPAHECARLGEEIQQHPIDVAFIGIGENGHIAFNDPPADFIVGDPYLVVDLDEACRKQQLGEGWFGSLEQVPQQAISMSPRQIMASKSIICSVPNARKADAVQAAVEGPVTPDVPASILQEHANATLYLDAAAASELGDLG